MTKHNHKISTGFIKKNRRYNRLNTTKWISISTTLLGADWLKYEGEIIWLYGVSMEFMLSMQFSE